MLSFALFSYSTLLVPESSRISADSWSPESKGSTAYLERNHLSVSYIMSSQNQETEKIAKLFREASELFTSVRCQDATAQLCDIVAKNQTANADILSQHRLNADLSSKLATETAKLEDTKARLDRALKEKKESSAQVQETQKELRKIKEMEANQKKELEKERERVENELTTARAELERLRGFSITLVPLSSCRKEMCV